MPRSQEMAGYFASAFEISSRVNTYGGGFRSFRRANPELDRDIATQIWDRTFERGQRVKYFEQANSGWFVNYSKLGCSQNTEYIFARYEINYHDSDGNQYVWYGAVHTELERRIGQNRDSLLAKVMQQMRGKYPERFRDINMMNFIDNIKLLDVRCAISRGTQV